MRETDLAALANQDLPFERLVEIAAPARPLVRHPLFQAMVVFENSEGIVLSLGGGVSAVRRPVLTGAVPFDLSVVLTDGRTTEREAGGLAGELEFACDMFDRASAELLAARLVRFLAAVAADPGLRVDQVELLSAGEREQILAGWNDTATARPGVPVGELFAEQAARTPDAVAVADGGVVVSYAELDRRASRLARYLIGAGAGPERIVALLLPRSGRLIESVLAVLKSGAAFLAIDPGYPPERVAFILADAGPVLVVTDTARRGPAARRHPHPAGRRRRNDGRTGPAVRRGGDGRGPDRAAASRAPGLRDLHLGVDRDAQGGDDHPARVREPDRGPGTVRRPAGAPVFPVHLARVRRLLPGVDVGAGQRRGPDRGAG